MSSLFRVSCLRRSAGRLVAGARLPVLALFALFGLAGNAAFAATQTASIMVSVFVGAGCQVSPVVGSTSAPGASAAPVSVNCSLPVAYQMDVTSSARMELASLSSYSPIVSGLNAYAHGGVVDSLLGNSRSAQATGESESGLDGIVSSDMSVAAGAAGEGPADGSGAHTVTVTIVY
jgi:hypothetical protein